MSDPKMPRWQHWAQFRFAVVGGLLSSPPEGGHPVNRLRELLPDQWKPLPKDERGLILAAKA